MNRRPESNLFKAGLWRGGLTVILLSLPALLSACVEERLHPWVGVVLTDGSAFRADLLQDRIRVRCDLGDLDVNTDQLRWVVFDAKADVVVSGNAELIGRVLTDKFPFVTRKGVFIVPRKKLQKITFFYPALAPRPVASAAKSAAPASQPAQKGPPDKSLSQ